MSADFTGKWRKRLQGRFGDQTETSVSPSSLRQGPKLWTVSARISLAKVTLLNTGLAAALGSLEWVGTQATDLLIAVHRTFGFAENVAEVALRP